MANFRSLLSAMLAGLVLVVLAAVAAELVSGPKHGHRINTDALPWYWFIVFALVALFLLHRRAALSFPTAVLIAAPSLAVVAFSFVRTPTAALL